MRNLLEYPITKEEIVVTLQRELAEAQARIERNMVCGDITPVALQKAIEIVQASDLP